LLPSNKGHQIITLYVATESCLDLSKMQGSILSNDVVGY